MSRTKRRALTRRTWVFSLCFYLIWEHLETAPSLYAIQTDGRCDSARYLSTSVFCCQICAKASAGHVDSDILENWGSSVQLKRSLVLKAFIAIMAADIFQLARRGASFVSFITVRCCFVKWAEGFVVFFFLPVVLLSGFRPCSAQSPLRKALGRKSRIGH